MFLLLHELDIPSVVGSENSLVDLTFCHLIKEIGEVKEAFHKLGRKFVFCLFLVFEVALAHPVSNATPLNNVPAMGKGET